MSDFLQGLGVGFLICLAHSIMWGYWHFKDRGEWEEEQKRRDQMWQQRCADIVLNNYVRRFKHGE